MQKLVTYSVEDEDSVYRWHRDWALITEMKDRARYLKVNISLDALDVFLHPFMALHSWSTCQDKPVCCCMRFWLNDSGWVILHHESCLRDPLMCKLLYIECELARTSAHVLHILSTKHASCAPGRTENSFKVLTSVI